ncbi:hypothetical protein B0H13DRAFT_1078265 [Mycena leptocephala]|nr:hypothetical protein B0H13DRAFT_1078265 [Mycena leptocephala]
MVYFAVRDMCEMENLMCVCPQWGLAVEHHDFWNPAIQLFDPNNGYTHFGSPLPRPANTGRPFALVSVLTQPTQPSPMTFWTSRTLVETICTRVLRIPLRASLRILPDAGTLPCCGDRRLPSNAPPRLRVATGQPPLDGHDPTGTKGRSSDAG